MTASRVVQLPFWVECWLIASSLICLIDVSFTMLRPHSTRGGALENVYYLWNIYADVDIRYADAKDIVTMATGRLMLVEIVMDWVAAWMNRVGSRHTLLTAFTSSAFVFWKTAVFLMLYVGVPEGNPSYFVEGTPIWKIAVVFWFMNGIWLVMPFAVMLTLWNKIALPVRSLSVDNISDQSDQKQLV
ncbi:unnamed protein product [Bursaphelenchus xylophilus]|uniref:(pine wood nematode) hypothetical protein n=1 Tax=Bursaphelenchus xylophilus TaxID=6326 RepID=A0A1I7SSG8_BURXY|nr:unnamed protein product [Bursaphelenchus xylophilus]CAG9097565.1 unnamed protein product [Bursaphelenchus xylophilus]